MNAGRERSIHNAVGLRLLADLQPTWPRWTENGISMDRTTVLDVRQYIHSTSRCQRLNLEIRWHTSRFEIAVDSAVLDSKTFGAGTFRPQLHPKSHLVVTWYWNVDDDDVFVDVLARPFIFEDHLPKSEPLWLPCSLCLTAEHCACAVCDLCHGAYCDRRRRACRHCHLDGCARCISNHQHYCGP